MCGFLRDLAGGSVDQRNVHQVLQLGEADAEYITDDDAAVLDEEDPEIGVRTAHAADPGQRVCALGHDLGRAVVCQFAKSPLADTW
jgi:hypothetical protein